LAATWVMVRRGSEEVKASNTAKVFSTDFT
jgi:hypothetical protein